MTTNQFSARGFGPGLPPEGAPLTVQPSGDTLHIDGWPDVASVRRDQATLLRQGNLLSLEWDTPEGRCALLPENPEALKAWKPAVAQHDGATRRWLWVSLFVVLGLPLLLLALFFGFRSEIIDAVVVRIPAAQEKQLAEKLWQMQSAQLKLIEGTAANRFIEDVGARLVAAKPTPYQYHFFLADEASVNAFAMPGGYVVVNSGLIEKADSAEEVAGVLAHEIEHAEQRHTLRGMVQQAGLTAIWMAATGDVGSGLAGQWLQQLAGLQFSREQESSADAGGYERLIAAKIDPHGMASFFDKLAKQQGDMPGALSLLSTHPASAERTAAINAKLQAAPVFPPLAYDWAAVKASVVRK